MKTDTPAKRRDCLALLCRLPVTLLGQKELVRVGLTVGKPRVIRSQARRTVWVKHGDLMLTAEGGILALRALVEAPSEWWTGGVLRSLRSQLKWCLKYQQGKARS